MFRSSCDSTNLGDSLARLNAGGEGDISGRGEAGEGEAGGLSSQRGEDSSPPTTTPSLISGLEWHRWTGTRGSSRFSPERINICVRVHPQSWFLSMWAELIVLQTWKGTASTLKINGSTELHYRLPTSIWNFVYLTDSLENTQTHTFITQCSLIKHWCKGTNTTKVQKHKLLPTFKKDQTNTSSLTLSCLTTTNSCITSICKFSVHLSLSHTCGVGSKTAQNKGL